MPRLSEIQSEQYGFMEFKDLPWFSEAASHKGLAQGGIYLLSGAEGSGKTNMALQMSVDLALQGYRILYLPLEQAPAEIKNRIENLILPARWKAQEIKIGSSEPFQEGLRKLKSAMETEDKWEQETSRIDGHLFLDSSISSMEALPDFLTRQVLGSGQYAGIHLIVVDSIQALGTAPTSSKPYQELFKFNRWSKEHKITALLIGQITKGGAIAGPRSLAHNVDCVLYLRKAMRLRPLFVPKNRFGPERHEPLTLVMNDYGCLEKSIHVKPKASLAYGYMHSELIEVQALVKLPKYGERAGIKAPYLPKQKLSQLVGIISSMHDIDISDLTFEINCAIPGGRPYVPILDLPLAISMLSSYFQRAIPMGSLIVGEVDLFQNIRPPAERVSEEIAEILFNKSEVPLARHIRQVYISDQAAPQLQAALDGYGMDVKVHAASNLEELVRIIWPDVIE